MSIVILDCLKRQRDICVKNVIPSQNTAFMFTPALIVEGRVRQKGQRLTITASLLTKIDQHCNFTGAQVVSCRSCDRGQRKENPDLAKNQSDCRIHYRLLQKAWAISRNKKFRHWNIYYNKFKLIQIVRILDEWILVEVKLPSKNFWYYVVTLWPSIKVWSCQKKLKI